MSKIGKIPVKIKDGVSVLIENSKVNIQGPLGSFSYDVPEKIEINISDKNLVVSQKKEFANDTRAIFGLTRATLVNMIKGVSEGFKKDLELSGVGYRAQVSGNSLVLSVGFSHPVKIDAPEGIKFTVSENIITVSGKDNTLVGDMAAKIRSVRVPEPYKGKGIKYKGEKIRRKVGKAAKAVGAK